MIQETFQHTSSFPLHDGLLKRLLSDYNKYLEIQTMPLHKQ